MRIAKELVYRVVDMQFLPRVVVQETHAGTGISAGRVVSAKLEIRGTKKVSRFSLYNPCYRASLLRKRVLHFLEAQQWTVPTAHGSHFFGCYPACSTLLKAESSLIVGGDTIEQVVQNSSRILRLLRSVGIYCAVANLNINIHKGNVQHD